MTFRQSLVHGRNNRFIRQHRIGVLHPAFAKIAHLLSNQPVAEAELPRRISITPFPSRLRCGPFRPQKIMIEFANRLWKRFDT
jgi:hypothetical protein